MTHTRRAVLGTVATGLFAGCLASASESPNGGEQPACSHADPVLIADRLMNVEAGGSYVKRVDLAIDDELRIEVRTLDGARPALTVEAPNGDLLIEGEPTETIDETLTATEAGRHYVRFTNEAWLTDGQWDLDLSYAGYSCE